MLAHRRRRSPRRFELTLLLCLLLGVSLLVGCGTGISSKMPTLRLAKIYKATWTKVATPSL